MTLSLRSVKAMAADDDNNIVVIIMPCRNLRLFVMHHASSWIFFMWLSQNLGDQRDEISLSISIFSIKRSTGGCYWYSLKSDQQVNNYLDATSIGISNSVNFGRTRHLCPKIYVWKITKMPEFYLIFSRKNAKIFTYLPKYFKDFFGG